jgi:hypothetical protein
MLRLMLDVMADYIAIGCTDTKRAITFLPCEFDSMLSEPSGRIRLERLYGLGEGHIGRKSNQHMHMVRHAARCNHGNPNVRSDSVQVCEKLWKKIRWNEIAPFLRAENHVNQDIGIFVSHGAAPSGLSSRCHAFPALTCRAFVSRAFGTASLLGRAWTSSQIPGRRRSACQSSRIRHSSGFFCTDSHRARVSSDTTAGKESGSIGTRRTARFAD